MADTGSVQASKVQTTTECFDGKSFSTYAEAAKCKKELGDNYQLVEARSVHGEMKTVKSIWTVRTNPKGK
jgi:hypothetical protein